MSKKNYKEKEKHCESGLSSYPYFATEKSSGVVLQKRSQVVGRFTMNIFVFLS